MWQLFLVFVGVQAAWHTIDVYETDSQLFTHQKQPPQSHSQSGQDLTVARLHPAPGFFIDLAANDALHISNTAMLERDLGWDGICIEPNPAYWPRLVQRRCKLAGVVIGRVTGTPVKFAFRSVFGGIIGKHYDNKIAKENTSVRFMRLVSLRDLFEQFSVPRVITYFSLDVEGAEDDVMSTFPWRTHCIKILTVERPSDALRLVLRTNGMNYLQLHGPAHWGDEMWVNRTLL
jgi:hypothetical protein